MLLALVWQLAENRKLQEEAASLRETAIAKGRERTSIGSTGRDDVDRTGGSERKGVSALQIGELARLLDEDDPVVRARLLVDFAEGLRVEDLEAALKELRELGGDGGPDQRLLAHLLLVRWARANPKAALASLQAGVTKKNYEDSFSILGGIAAEDPKRAAAWLSDPANKPVQYSWLAQRLAATVARQWMEQDLEAALAWAVTLPKQQQAGAYAAMAGKLASSDPQRAAELALSLKTGDARRIALGEVAEVWASRSPAEAAEWAQGLDADVRERVTRRTLEAWSESEPRAAAKFVDATAAEERQGYLTTVAGRWSQTDAAEAASWVAQQPDGPGRTDAMGHVMWNWTNQDPEAAGTWIGGQPDGPARDQGIAGLAKAAFDFDPEAALNWAIAIGNDEMRERSVNHGLRQWRQSNAAAADAWAKENQLEVPQPNQGKKD